MRTRVWRRRAARTALRRRSRSARTARCSPRARTRTIRAAGGRPPSSWSRANSTWSTTRSRTTPSTATSSPRTRYARRIKSKQRVFEPFLLLLLECRLMCACVYIHTVARCRPTICTRKCSQCRTICAKCKHNTTRRASVGSSFTTRLFFFSSYKSENPSKDFRKACGALSVHFDDKLVTLSVIVSASLSTLLFCLFVGLIRFDCCSSSLSATKSRASRRRPS